MAKHISRLLFVALLALPSFAFAATFAKDPIFLSRTPAQEGQSVHVYAVISNTDSAAFVGTLVFYDNGNRIGASSINLAAGATQTASILWTPTGGDHPLSAQLVAKNGTIAEEVKQNIGVIAKPKPVASSSTAFIANTAAQTAASIDSSAAIQKDIAGVSPQVAGAAVPVFSFIDGARDSIAGILDGQIQTTQQKVGKTPKPGIVAGASTASTFKDARLENPSTGFWYWLYTIYLWILLAVRWLIGNAGIFYPFVAFVFLFSLFRMYRRFRRPY